MSKCSLCLIVLVFASLHLSAQSAVSSQQHRAARAPFTFVGFDDILPRAIGEETVKKVFKREITDDFTIDDGISLQNASSEAVQSPANDELKPITDAASDEDATDKDSSNDDLLTENKSTSTGNDLEEDNNEGHESTQEPGQFNAASAEEVESEIETNEKETVSTEKSIVDEENADDTEDISVENIKLGAGDDNVLGKLMAPDEGSGDGDDEDGADKTPAIEEDTDNSKDYVDSSEAEEATSVDISTDSKESIDTPSQDYIDASEAEKATTVDISIDSDESIDTPDEPPIPNPSPKEETRKDFKVDELLEVSTTDMTESSGEETAEGSGGDPGIPIDSEENTSATEKTDPPFVVGGRNFNPTVGPPSPTEAVSEEANNTDNTAIKKAGLGNTGGINEIGVKVIEKETVAEAPEEKTGSSSGSFIVLGAIMVTIVVLLAYTVIKSRRQKKARRTGNIAKAQEDQGREMKEVDKLLVPRTNGFSAPNGGPRDEERLPLKSFKEDFNEGHPTKNGSMPEELTNVIVENVPRLNMAPNSNGSAPNENQSDSEQDSWVPGPGKALESTKIKMYIDEDSIPKTPIMIVNRGPAPN